MERVAEACGVTDIPPSPPSLSLSFCLWLFLHSIEAKLRYKTTLNPRHWIAESRPPLFIVCLASEAFRLPGQLGLRYLTFCNVSRELAEVCLLKTMVCRQRELNVGFLAAFQPDSLMNSR